MADLPRQSPPIELPGGVRLLPAAARFTLRGRPPVMAAAGAALGLNITDAAGRSAANSERAALWMGPDEQLILAAVTDGEAMGTQLRAALSALPHSLVDMSHRQLALEV